MSARETAGRALMDANLTIDRAIAALALERDEVIVERDALKADFSDVAQENARLKYANEAAKVETANFRTQLDAADLLATASYAEVQRLRAQLDAIHGLHTDSVAGVCPSCYRLNEASDTDDGLVDWPCPTLRAMGVKDVVPLPTLPAEADRYGRVFNAITRAIPRDRFVSLSERDAITRAVFAALDTSPVESADTREQIVDELATTLQGTGEGVAVTNSYTEGKQAGYLEAAGAVRHHYDLDVESADTAPEVLTDEPGPEVTEVWDRVGDRWARNTAGRWVFMGERTQSTPDEIDPVGRPWYAVAAYAPITTRRPA